MLPRWYNGQDIKDAESVDIQNLMIPIREWGTTDVSGTPKPDASKAYVENSESITKIGLRPKTIYFDGSGEYVDIYPTIRERTIKDVRDMMVSSDQYYPSTTIYTDEDARIDRILSVQTTFDTGLAGDTSGKTSVDSQYTELGTTIYTSLPSGTTYLPVYQYQGEYTPAESGTLDLSVGLNISGLVSLSGISSAVVSVSIKRPEYQGLTILSKQRELYPTTGSNTVEFGNISFSVGEWLNADPFELALSLLRYGFPVKEIFGTLGEANFIYVKKIASLSPETKVYSNLSPTMLLYEEREEDLPDIVVGKDAMYYHNDTPGVPWNSEEQSFGFAGTKKLFRTLGEAVEKGRKKP